MTVNEINGNVLCDDVSSLARPIVFQGFGWYSLDDDNIYRVDGLQKELFFYDKDGSPVLTKKFRPTFSRIKIEPKQ